jgi:hypothetical protein
VTTHNSGRTRGYQRDRMIEEELKLLREEVARQDKLDAWSHDSDCACWACIGRLQASVVQAYVRRMREVS